MKSMTGYGEAAAQGRWAKIAVQVRTLNHRHLDIQLRVPREYLSIEEEIRKVLRERISRGRVEIFISRSPLRAQTRRLELDEDLLDQYFRTLRRVKKKFGLKGEVDLSLFPRFPEIFQIREEELRGGGEGRLALHALRMALENLERSRNREGHQLLVDIRSQVRRLRKICAGLSKEAEAIQSRFREPHPEGEASHLPDMAREGTESGNWTFKGDIHEETVRLRSHVAELTHLIGGREPVGKRVDFLLQEIQRELNTISSKAPQLSAVQLVLEGKERVEKIREQAQNVE